MTNRPVNFNDPTGHKACDEIDGNGNCYTEEDVSEHLKKERETKSKEKAALDKMFDPWNGLFDNTDPTENDDLGILWFAIDDLYVSMDIDFDLAARNRESNPLTFDDINNNDATRLAVGPLLGRARYIPYEMFLAQLGIPHDIENHSTNYEPQYLSALMKYHPRELAYAKQEYARIYPDEYTELVQDWGPGPLGPIE